METTVIALGGNALLKKGEKANLSNQLKNTKKALKDILNVFRKYNVVLTHGSGPQIGGQLLQGEISKKKVFPMPLDVLDAEVQGQLGYLIGQSLMNIIKKPVLTIITQVLVDRKDKSFRNPTKFVGPFYNKGQASALKKKGMKIKKDSNRGYRRVVASPKPIKIIECNIIKKLVKGNIVIAAGGGGIPVYKDKGKLKGIEAVIDKDRASYLLAKGINAKYLFILTGIDNVYLNFGKKSQKKLGKVKLKDIKEYYKQGHFPEGSMGPKIEASIKFLENKGEKVIITNPRLLEKAIKRKAGTIIVK